MSHPLLYEINTRCWLRELSGQTGSRITLTTVPDREFARWQELGFTHIWLMGVWASGPRARALALSEPELRNAYDQALPGWRRADVAGSPYAIANYSVPRALGGEAGLRIFRERLNARGLKLVLDFVPNHVGMDHSWVGEQPHLFVQSPVPRPETFPQQTPTGVRWLAWGRDPNFPPWRDTVQLGYRRFATRAAMKELLESIASRCDGVRCDMAMLVLNDVFAKTWAWERFPFEASAPAPEFWEQAIPAVRQAHPGFLFIAEVYWDLESRLRDLGFDYTYDKGLYDEIVRRQPAGVQRRLLGAARESITRGVHFLENHDEPRVAAVLSLAEQRAAALLMLGLPGMRLLHEGQLAGATIRTPVQLVRRPVEPAQSQIAQLYERLLLSLRRTSVGCGQGGVLSPGEAWPGNTTARNFVVVQWRGTSPVFDLVVVNLSPSRSQCLVPLTVPGLSACDWTLNDLIGEESHRRSGTELERQGLYLDLPAHGAQLFQVAPAGWRSGAVSVSLMHPRQTFWK